MLNCKNENCENVEVKVAAQTGSIYMIYRKHKVKNGTDYKQAPIIVRFYGPILLNLIGQLSEKL